MHIFGDQVDVKTLKAIADVLELTVRPDKELATKELATNALTYAPEKI